MTIDQPNARYPHLWVVVRVDADLPAERVEDMVTVVSAFRDRAAAEAEVARLNALNGTEHCRYSTQVARLKGP